MKPKILFLCTGNSCRSQLAEGWTRALKADQLEAYSAGIQPKGVDVRAVKAMAEAGIDISGQNQTHTSAAGWLRRFCLSIRPLPSGKQPGTLYWGV